MPNYRVAERAFVPNGFNAAAQPSQESDSGWSIAPRDLSYGGMRLPIRDNAGRVQWIPTSQLSPLVTLRSNLPQLDDSPDAQRLALGRILAKHLLGEGPDSILPAAWPTRAQGLPPANLASPTTSGSPTSGDDFDTSSRVSRPMGPVTDPEGADALNDTYGPDADLVAGRVLRDGFSWLWNMPLNKGQAQSDIDVIERYIGQHPSEANNSVVRGLLSDAQRRAQLPPLTLGQLLSAGSLFAGPISSGTRFIGAAQTAGDAASLARGTSAAAILPAASGYRGATLGKATSNDYRATFFEANPDLEGKVVVHHAVPQRTLTVYPDVVTKSEIHSFENLRGIPNEINDELHLRKIAKEWKQFYKANPAPTKAQLLQKATEIDLKYGSQFKPPISGEQ